jgi:hypothetical protein
MASKRRRGKVPGRTKRVKAGDLICQAGKAVIVVKTKNGRPLQVIGVADAQDVLDVVQEAGGGDRYDVNIYEALENLQASGDES